MIAFQKTYKNLSTHHYVVFSIEISYFGSKTNVPSGHSILSLLFDGHLVQGARIATSDVCSDLTSSTLLLTNFQGAVAHTSSTLNLTIQTLFPFTTTQVGFRQVSLLLYTSAPYMMYSDSPICQASGTNALTYDRCTCPYGQAYLNSILWTCLGCTNPCATCFLCGSTNCYTCKTGYFWKGGQCAQSPPCCASYNGTYCASCTPGCFNYGYGVCQAACDANDGYYSVEILGTTYCFPKCQDSSQFRYLNGSCESLCPSPLSVLSYSVNDTSLTYCYNPCPSSQYLYPDSSCNTTCANPLTQITVGDIPCCRSPCSNPGHFYFNAISSCLPSCSSPLVASSVQGILYCSNPCQSSQYIYPNGSCLNSCQSPFTPESEPGVNYCFYDCSGYLSPNNTCLSECNSPFKKRVKDAILIYCDSPCSNSTDYYYPEDGSCQSHCEYPYQSKNENGYLQVCTLKATQAEAEQAKKLAQTTAVANSISSGGIVAGSLLASGDSAAATMGSLTKMLSYIKFMDIKFPPKLQLLFDSQTSNSSLLSSIPNRLRDKTGNKSPPTNFEKYNVSPSFIINFWPSLIILVAILIAIFIFLIFSVFMKSCTALSNILHKILSALKWNTFLTLFCSYCGDIVLFSALEFQTVQTDNVWTDLSLVLCIGINILVFYILYKILTVNFSVRKIQKNNPTEKEIDKNFADYKTFFECYKGDSYLQQIFMFIFMIRIGLFNGIIGYLYSYPLVQAILIILINATILAYLLFKRPMRRIINLVQQILLEGIIFVFNIGVFILAILDAQDQENETMRENIGDMLIMINVIVPFLAMVLIAVKILLISWEFYKNYKKSKTQAHKKWPTISIQQTRAPSHSTQNASSGLQFREADSINLSFTTNQTSHNLLRTKKNNYNNNSLFPAGSNLEHYFILFIL